MEMGDRSGMGSNGVEVGRVGLAAPITTDS